MKIVIAAALAAFLMGCASDGSYYTASGMLVCPTGTTKMYPHGGGLPTCIENAYVKDYFGSK